MLVPAKMLSTCGVEASGWDVGGNFFVERTVLQWSGGDEEEIELRSSLADGDVVFLRLLQGGPDNPPIAYRAARIHPPHADGKSRVLLAPLRRRQTHHQELARWIAAMVECR